MTSRGLCNMLLGAATGDKGVPRVEAKEPKPRPEVWAFVVLEGFAWSLSAARRRSSG